MEEYEEQRFQKFQRIQQILKDSVNRTLHNFISMFVLIKMYDKANEEEALEIKKFIDVIKEEIKNVHFAQIDMNKDFTGEQIKILQRDTEIILNNCLEPITNKIKK